MTQLRESRSIKRRRTETGKVQNLQFVKKFMSVLNNRSRNKAETGRNLKIYEDKYLQIEPRATFRQNGICTTVVKGNILQRGRREIGRPRQI
jgi:hypothetical protein